MYYIKIKQNCIILLDKQEEERHNLVTSQFSYESLDLNCSIAPHIVKQWLTIMLGFLVEEEAL